MEIDIAIILFPQGMERNCAIVRRRSLLLLAEVEVGQGVQ